MRAVLAGLLLLWAVCAPPAHAFELGLPVACTIGETCFLQQGPDMDPVAGSWTDSICGGATYDGHEGTDIRVRALADVGTVDVIAAAPGVVKAVRDGMPDQFAETDADRAAIAGRECGNGVLIDHGEGWTTQYCHMAQDSIAVETGQSVAEGDVVGKIGASGDVAFPHVHFQLKKDEAPIDPFTGHALSGTCGDGTPLWRQEAAAQIVGWEGSVLGLSVAGEVPEHERLTLTGAPPIPTTQSEVYVGWVWLINLQKGDEVTVQLEGERGIVSEDTQVIDQNKADWSAYVGKRGSPPAETYRVRAVVIRNGVPAISVEEVVEVR